jgi:hypothetical protein
MVMSLRRTSKANVTWRTIQVTTTQVTTTQVTITLRRAIREVLTRAQNHFVRLSAQR